MLRATLVIVALLTLTMVGCDYRNQLGIENPYELDIRVMDHNGNRPYPREAIVKVVQTDDALVTGADGWARGLKVPRDAHDVTVRVVWTDNCFNPHTDEHNYHLEHGKNEFPFWVNTMCWH